MEDALIQKKILHAGTKAVDFEDGTKVHIHFQTRLCDYDRTVIDDSRKMGKRCPLEIVLGKKFKLEVWEAIVQKMALNEVASFTVDKNLVQQYPFVSKTLRELDVPPEKRKSTHCCAYTLQTEGVGYEDLNNLLKYPQNLEFIIELVEVEEPSSYKKDTWQLDDKQRLNLIPELKNVGNERFLEQVYDEAMDNYQSALRLIEQLMLKEKPHDEEWNLLEQMKLPLLLNMSQCKLYDKEYYSVINYCTKAIEIDSKNVKAYYRRAKAHVGAWNPKEAIADFHKVMELDQSLIPHVKKELIQLEELSQQKNCEDKEKLKKLFDIEKSQN